MRPADVASLLLPGGNRSSHADWSNVRIIHFNNNSTPARLTEAAAATLPRGCTFIGKCVLAVENDASGIKAQLLGPTLLNSTFVACRVSLAARVEYSTLECCHVAAGATIRHCPSVSSSGTSHLLAVLANSAASAPPPPAGPPVWSCTARVGNGMGGRAVPLSDVLSFDAYVALSRAEPAPPGDLIAANALATARGVALSAATAAGSYRSSIGKGAALLGCPEVTRLVCRGPVLLVCATVVDCVIHASASAPTLVRGGATLRACVLHPGVVVDGGATVTASVLCSGSGAHEGASVTECVIAGGSTVTRGEASHSLIGPFVGFHHTALLIAALWPRGRGNVAAGALLGSNHTGKLPDQESRPGEGTFFGLGVMAKLPLVLDGSPYSLVAAGATLLPQRVDFPFSLVTPPVAPPAGVPPAFNELLPGWMLYDNAFSLARSEAKFAQRAAALASSVAGGAAGGGVGSNEDRGDVVAEGYAASPAAVVPPAAPSAIATRPDIVDLMRGARRRLAAVPAAATAAGPTAPPTAKYYTEATLEGVGKCFVSEASRLRGLRAYDRAIRAYVLHAVFIAATSSTSSSSGGGQERSQHQQQQHRQLAALAISNRGSSNSGGTNGTVGTLSRHALEVGAEVGIIVAVPSPSSVKGGMPLPLLVGGVARLAALLLEYSELTAEDAAAALASLARDDDRGRRVQGAADYAVAHPPAEEDAVVGMLRRRAAGVAEAVQTWCVGVGWGGN